MLVLVACHGDPSDGPAGDGVTTDTGTAYDLPAGAVSVVDFVTELPVVGATVDVDGATETTNADGTALLDLPPSTLFDFVIAHPDYLTQRLRQASGSAQWVFREAVARPQDADAVAASLGRTRDPALAMVVVSVETPVSGADVLRFEPLVGATVALDAAGGFSFVVGPGGVPVEGSTLLTGGENFVVFVDVSPGEVGFAITAPDGETCVTASEYPTLVDTLPAVAGEVTATIASCY